MKTHKLIYRDELGFSSELITEAQYIYFNQILNDKNTHTLSLQTKKGILTIKKSAIETIRPLNENEKPKINNSNQLGDGSKTQEQLRIEEMDKIVYDCRKFLKTWYDLKDQNEEELRKNLVIESSEKYGVWNTSIQLCYWGREITKENISLQKFHAKIYKIAKSKGYNCVASMYASKELAKKEVFKFL